MGTKNQSLAKKSPITTSALPTSDKVFNETYAIRCVDKAATVALRSDKPILQALQPEQKQQAAIVISAAITKMVHLLTQQDNAEDVGLGFAHVLFSRYPDWRMYDVSVFVKHCMSTSRPKTYGKVNTEVLFEWAAEYENIRCQSREQLSKEPEQQMQDIEPDKAVQDMVSEAVKKMRAYNPEPATSPIQKQHIQKLKERYGTNDIKH